MAVFNQRLVKKGKGQPAIPLAEQGDVTVALCEKHLQALIAKGLDADTVPKTRDLISETRAKGDARHEARDTSLTATRSLVASKAKGKKLKRELCLSAQLALSRDVPEELPAIEAIQSVKTGDSLERLIAYFDQIKPHVAKYDERLKRYLDNQSPLARLEEIRTELHQAEQHQESKRAELPAETLRHYEVKGRLLEAIERINAVARLAFDGHADIIGLFNKDILLRARHSGGRKADDGSKDPATTPVASNDGPQPG